MKPTINLDEFNDEATARNFAAQIQFNITSKELEISQLDVAAAAEKARLTLQLSGIDIRLKVQKDQKNREKAQMNVNLTAINARIETFI